MKPESQINVLIADDHDLIREALKLLLNEQEDIKVIGEAANGYQIVECARAMDPDVILMDVSMPLMDGIEATREIKALKPDIAVIGLSMHETFEFGKKMIEAGATNFISKNLHYLDLVQAIKSAAHS